MVPVKDIFTDYPPVDAFFVRRLTQNTTGIFGNHNQESGQRVPKSYDELMRSANDLIEMIGGDTSLIKIKKGVRAPKSTNPKPARKRSPKTVAKNLDQLDGIAKEVQRRWRELEHHQYWINVKRIRSNPLDWFHRDPGTSEVIHFFQNVSEPEGKTVLIMHNHAYNENCTFDTGCYEFTRDQG